MDKMTLKLERLSEKKAMKVSIFLLCLITIPAYSASTCQSEYKGYSIVNKPIENVEECKSEILTQLFAKYKRGGICLLEKEVEIDWYHGSSPAKLEAKSFPCSTFRDLADAEGSVVTVNLVTEALKQTEPQVDCEPLAPLPTLETVPYNDLPKLGVQFKDEKGLKEAIEELNKKGAKLNVSDIFDKLKNGSFSMKLLNDNNFAKMGTKGSGSDRGLTHGMNLHFEHNIKDGKYVMVVDYDTSLYTSYTNPSDPNYTHINGVTHVDQYFIEENIAKVALKSVKSDNAFYWTAGGGFHELNKDDAKRSGLISSATQQLAFHDWFIKMQQKDEPGKRVTTKVYNDVGQAGSERSLFVEGNVGTRLAYKPFNSESLKLFIDADVGARITGVKDASYAESKISANADVRIIGNIAARGTVEKSARIYTTGQMTTDKVIGVTVGSRAFQVGMRMVEQDGGRSADYRNPLPKDFARRDYYAPERPRTYQITAKILW